MTNDNNMEMIFIIIISLTNGKTAHAAMEIPSQLKSTQLFVNKAGPCRHLNNDHYDDDDDDNDDIYYDAVCVCVFVCHEKSSLPPGSLL